MDFAYLENFTAGDRRVIREILELFVEQAAMWQGKFAGPDSDWRDVVHTLKGASRGIGANELGDVCAQVEKGDEQGVPTLRAALQAAVVDVKRYLAAEG